MTKFGGTSGGGGGGTRLVSLAEAPAAPGATGATASGGGEVSLTTVHALKGVKPDRAKGIIPNVAIMSVGPAKGHGFEIDQRTLETLVEAFNAHPNGVKSRFTHPELTFGMVDGLAVLVGRAKNPRIEGDVVRGDMHLGKYAQVSPSGNLFEYLMTVAEDEPEEVGISVVAGFDFERIVDQRTGETQKLLGRVKFVKAADFVGDPAANRNGLLSTPGTSGNPGAGAKPSTSPSGPGESMSKLLLAFLATLGLALTATVEEAKAFIAGLSDEDGNPKRSIANILADKNLSDAQRDEKLKALGYKVEGPAGGDQKLVKLASNTPAAAPPLQNSSDNSETPGANLQSQVDTAVQRALAAQQQAIAQRTSAITTLATQAGLGSEWVAQQLATNASIEQAQQAAIQALTQSQAPIAGLRISGGEDGRRSLVAGIQDAMLSRVGAALYEELPDGQPKMGEDGKALRRNPHPRSLEMQHLSLVEIGRQYLAQLGVNRAGSIDPREVAQLCLDRLALAGHIGGVALAHATGDFPGILGNVLNKVLLPAYEEEFSTWESWAIETPVNDFREVQFHSMGQVAVPPRVMEGAEYTFGTMGEKYEKGQAFKYGLLLALTWESFVADDLRAFQEGAFGFAQSAHALENDLIYAKVTGNQTMNEDGKALFHADHNNLNYGAGAAALDEDTLADMRTGMVLQRGIAPKTGTNGRRLNLRPNVFLVPWAQEVKARRLVASMVKIGGTNDEPNAEFIRELQVVAESRLDDNSTTAHYLVAAKKMAAPAGRILKLRGYATPTVERLMTGSSVDGVTWKLRHVAGAAITDWRAWQKNAGA